MLLDELELDYEQIGDFEFFCNFIAGGFDKSQTELILGDLDLTTFKPAINNKNDELVLYNEKEDFVIDECIYETIVGFIREVHGFKRSHDICGNQITKEYLINKERKLLKRHQDKPWESVLTNLISALVNCEQFKYNYSTVWDLNLYCFMDAVKRIQKYKNYNQIMQGYYSGGIDRKSISFNEIDWLSPLK